MTDFRLTGTSSNVDATILNLSDTHYRTSPTLNYARCQTNAVLFQTHALQQQFDICVHNGDIVDDAGGLANWNAFKAAHGKTTYAARGNHDYWATNAQLDIPDPGYYSANIGTNWRIIVLDSTEGGTQTNSGNYKLESTQQAWLVSELADAAADGKYVMIVMHVPVGGYAPMKYEKRQDADDPVSAASFNLTKDMMMDQYTLEELFNQYPNVKIISTGHWHLKDNAKDRYLSHFNPGAISGNFWQNPLPLYGEDPSYALITLFKDGNWDAVDKYYPYTN